MTRLAAIAVALALGVAACASGVSAPAVGSPETMCTASFCVDVPAGWSGEIGESYVSMHHELDPEHTFLTVGEINMEAIVTSAGGAWPVGTDEVVRSFWVLLEDAGVGSFERSERMVGGAVQSWGDHQTGRMWHLVFPVEGSRAIGVELRAPNESWETHADAVFASVQPAG